MANYKASTLSVFDFFKHYPDERSALDFLEAEYWPDGPICAFCGGTNTTPRPKRYGHHCNTKGCGKDFSVRIGTIFEKSKLPLKSWLYAMYMVETSRKSISSLQLSKELGITQKSAWFMLHRIRRACNAQGSKFTGIVEIDGTYIGGLEKNKHFKKKTKGNQGRSTKTKTAVVGMRSRDGKVKAQVMKKVNSKNMQKFLDDNIESGATIIHR